MWPVPKWQMYSLIRGGLTAGPALSWDGMGCGKGSWEPNTGRGASSPEDRSLTCSEGSNMPLSPTGPLGLV